MIDSYSMAVRDPGDLQLDELIHFGKIARRFGFQLSATIEYDGEYLTVGGERND